MCTKLSLSNSTFLCALQNNTDQFSRTEAAWFFHKSPPSFGLPPRWGWRDIPVNLPGLICDLLDWLKVSQGACAHLTRQGVRLPVSSHCHLRENERLDLISTLFSVICVIPVKDVTCLRTHLTSGGSVTFSELLSSVSIWQAFFSRCSP